MAATTSWTEKPGRPAPSGAVRASAGEEVTRRLLGGRRYRIGVRHRACYGACLCSKRRQHCRQRLRRRDREGAREHRCEFQGSLPILAAEMSQGAEVTDMIRIADQEFGRVDPRQLRRHPTCPRPSATPMCAWPLNEPKIEASGWLEVASLSRRQEWLGGTASERRRP
jgi:hypothetical protein